MSNLPYNTDAGNGITNVNELYDYMYKYPLCVFDNNFMKSYSNILAPESRKTSVAYIECMRLVQLSGDLIELIGHNITYTEMGDKYTDFMDYLSKCEGYGLCDAHEEPMKSYERIPAESDESDESDQDDAEDSASRWAAGPKHVTNVTDLSDSARCHYFAAQSGRDL